MEWQEDETHLQENQFQIQGAQTCTQLGGRNTPSEKIIYTSPYNSTWEVICDYHGSTVGSFDYMMTGCKKVKI